jgi:agmatinase
MDRDKTFFADQMHGSDRWMSDAIALMTDKVYITLDLDVLDPSIMPATGTPEPGGLDYYQLIRFLSRVFGKRNVVGFDIVEFAPLEGLNAPGFLVAKLYYKMLSYKYRFDHEK